MKKLTIEDIKAKFEAAGWSVHDNKYHGSQIPLSVTCPNSHKTEISWNNFQKKQGCKYCAGNVQYGLKEVAEAFATSGCKLLSNSYLNNHELLDYKCCCGNTSKICFRDFLRGVRCAKCKAGLLSEIKRVPHNKVAEFCDKNNLILLKTWFEGKKTKVEIRCHCGKTSILFWNQIRQNPTCRHNRHTKVGTKIGRRKNLSSPRLSHQNWKDSWTHPDSTICLADPKKFTRRSSLINFVKGITEQKYLVAYMHEWNDRKEQWIQHLRSMCGIYDQRIFARKCKINPISKEEVGDFCQKYHIQGKNNLSFQAWGMFYKEELIGVISLGRHHRNQEGGVVLDRMCFKYGVQVVGGANRLFAKCVEWARQNGHKSILSFSDNRYSRGAIYSTLGFELNLEMPPDYFYVLKSNPLKYFSKQSQRKTNAKCPVGMTEHEWADQRGLLRVWDCGKKRWVYNITEDK